MVRVTFGTTTYLEGGFSMPNHQQQIQLARRPKGVPAHDDFRFETIAVPEPKDGEVLVKTSYVSVDPYMRGRMQDTKSYVEPFALDEAITGGVIAEVLTDGDKLKKGDVVIGNLAWQEYSAVNESALRKLDTDIAPAQAYLGILGMTGLTAYFGPLDIGRPKKAKPSSFQARRAPSAQQSDRLPKSKARGLSASPDLMKKSRI